MKIKVLSRNPDDFLRETKRDIHKLPRNYDPSLHPFEAPREYTRALNAVKLERVFAKPFLASLDGHKDGVHCLCKHPTQLSTVLSGSYDGEIRIWNLAQRRCVKTLSAHEGFVRGMCFHPSGDYLFSCGDDSAIRQWKLSDAGEQPMNVILGKSAFHSMDHHWHNDMFATCGHQVDIWDEQRAEPLSSFTWGVDSTQCIRFNPIETHLLAAAATDRSIILYDTRGSTPIRKVVLKMKSNSLAWNPLEAFMFTAACDDYNLYTFDLRKLDRPVNVHMDHISAVMDVDYSPTGKEFVSGSFDRMLRIFPVDKGHSREVYHTKRMQRIVCVKWSLDDKFILSGSDEMNLRLWKATAWEKLGVLRPRERESLQYNDKLKEKFKHHPQVKRIARHRHVPNFVYQATKELQTIHFSQKRKEANRRKHSTPGSVPFVPERKKHVVNEVE